ncbi:iron-containing alcohol dehydrogenase [Neobacillus notoginsengisoli]|uniref:Iron-containing alcohol dehydrogenase n=1 Tax=Neobacillus notoginsengisoli TaxID=1578198 RepID=A0A417YYK3_9BACI|nr:iron-containing alcohol dehydrogenase [Neobacillus notoginsengisoli]RHW42842.1 iron-containing alcohol dehydrogenase [Neobacillus notoginsengisoli]
MKFSFYSPAKVHFGCGIRKEIGKAAKGYGEKCLIVRASVKNSKREEYFRDLTESLENNGVKYVVFEGVQPNPTTDMVEAAQKLAIEEQVDFIVAYGGGSAWIRQKRLP